MNKINFENLPSTSTPVNADNLNDMQENIEKSVTYIGSTQPATNEKIWIKKGKNLINKIINGYELYSADGSIGKNADWCVTDYIEVVAESNYVVSGLSSQNKYWYDENYNFIGRVTTNPSQAPNNAKYVRLNSLIAGCSNPILIQGSQIGTYEPYIEKEILVKNDNGIFEEFVNVEALKSIFNNTADKGYQKLPSGLILQWGNINITRDSSTTEQRVNINYPIEFNQVYTVLAAISDSGQGGFSANEAVGVRFIYNNYCEINLKQINKKSSDYDLIIRYIAIGI